jgi:flagellar L-ring protein FlgH
MRIARALSTMMTLIALSNMFSVLHASDNKNKKNAAASLTSLQQFVQRVQGQPVATITAPGSLWPLEGSLLTNLATDYKARRLNDLIVISVVEQTLAQASGAVTAQRDFTSSSGVTAIAGQVNTASFNPLYGLTSSSSLKGAGTANSQSLLQANISGRVVAVLPNGNLVVEAERQVTFNQQSQTIILRGVVRPGDISSSNSVPSTSLSDLELELKGKGVVSDSVRQPNLFVRLLMKLLNF